MAMKLCEEALKALGQYLLANHYRFITITPLSHARVLERNAAAQIPTLRDIFGWNRSFSLDAIDPDLKRLMQEADILQALGQQYKSKVRFSTLDDQIFVHSAYPTHAADSVFFGPDSYRFANLLKRETKKLATDGPLKILDIGTGSGIGGIIAVQCFPKKPVELLLADINPKALEFARINASLADIADVSYVESNLYSAIHAPVDLIISNPPYLLDSKTRDYRHGGGQYGELLSTRIVEEGLPLLAPNGTLILYTASAVVEGQDIFMRSLNTLMQNNDYQFSYEEVDPDVFGEELSQPEYQDADRIAVVALVVKKLN